MRKRLTALVTIGSIMALAAVAAAQPAPGAGEQHQPGAPPPGGHPGASMEMCRQMMGEMMMHHMRSMPMRRGGDEMPGMSGMMGPMGMMGGMPADPKRAAQMMEMRGEMMKAMGEILMKYGQRMQGDAAH